MTIQNSFRIQEPLSVFLSYAHEDEILCAQLEKHLQLLRRQNFISIWCNRQVLGGDEWIQESKEHLNAASIILLLISPDFLASDFCYDNEMQQAIERHTKGEGRIIPVILRPCDWHSAPFKHLQCLPRHGKAVTQWDDQDEAFLTIVQQLRQIIEQFTGPTLSSLDRTKRTALLKMVRRTWIDGLLNHSLNQGTLIDLNLQDRSDVFTNPWESVVQELQPMVRKLPSATSIAQIYDQANGKLLILGEPGAGKTTLLLRLAKTLLERAEKKLSYSVPVIFHLSTWPEKRLPLQIWLLNELEDKYQIPHNIGKALLSNNNLLFLLDGLDEVAPEYRALCVQAINSHLEAYSVSLVICCRSQYYKEISLLDKLQQAISILPLSKEQIEQHFQSAQGQFDALQEAIQNDAEFAALISSPLMLSIFCEAYRGVSSVDLLSKGTHEQVQQMAFAQYVKRMLNRRRQLKNGAEQRIMNWLTFLANYMKSHHQTIFSNETLQSVWLPHPLRYLCRWIVGLIYGLLVGVLVLLGSSLFIGLINWLNSRLSFEQDLSKGLSIGLGSGTFACLIGFLISMREDKKPQTDARESSQILREIFFGLGDESAQTKARQRSRQLTHTELYLWLLIGPLLGSLLWIAIGSNSELLIVLGLFLGSFYGFSFSQLVKHFLQIQYNKKRYKLIYYIEESATFPFIYLAIFGFPIGLIFLLFRELLPAMLAGLIIYYSFNIIVPFGPGIGLNAVIWRYMVRLVLWQRGSLPWKLTPFLNEAVERLLLRKVGHSYIFTHRLLLDYFASLNNEI